MRKFLTVGDLRKQRRDVTWFARVLAISKDRVTGSPIGERLTNFAMHSSILKFTFELLTKRPRCHTETVAAAALELSLVHLPLAVSPGHYAEAIV